MNFLFWCFWIIDLLLIALAVMGSNLRMSFGAHRDNGVWIIPGLIIILILSLVLKYHYKLKWSAVIVAGLPTIILFVMYLFDKKTKSY